ncbi:phosphatidylinositol-binding protein scs2 [Gamsiella multidivaricata]|nr:phosphatidylinositol-binding protein scs2 [Gamsiella multidivaricata]
MSIELEPATQLSFRRPLTEAIKEALIIRNPTQLPIAFKVKTTAPKQYCVRPNSGRVEPGQELEVQVQMQAMKEEPPLDFKCKDKFLVQSVAITAEREQLAPADLWPAIERDARDQIREKKIRCAFLPATGQQGVTETEDDEIPSATAPVSSRQPQQQSELAPAHFPGSPVQNQPDRISTNASTTTTTTTASSADVQPLRRELQSAQETIHNLQSTIEKLQRESNTVCPLGNFPWWPMTRN